MKLVTNTAIFPKSLVGYAYGNYKQDTHDNHAYNCTNIQH